MLGLDFGLNLRNVRPWPPIDASMDTKRVASPNDGASQRWVVRKLELSHATRLHPDDVSTKQSSQIFMRELSNLSVLFEQLLIGEVCPVKSESYGFVECRLMRNS
jgi:hypothetical protein